MTSPNQAQTARQNGARSQGPLTSEGKAISAQNARRHGICAREFKLNNPADQQAFNQLEQDLAFTYRAIEPAQKTAIRQLAVAMWREQTLNAMEQALIEAILIGEADAEKGGAGLPSMNSIYRYRARIDRDIKSAKAFIKDLQQERVQAFQQKLEQAREFSKMAMLNATKEDLGETGFSSFRSSITNEPEGAQTKTRETPLLSRPARRRAQKLADKRKK